MSEFSIKVHGLKDVEKQLFAFSDLLGKKVVIDSLKQGARVVQREAKRRAPKKTGRLRRSIVVRKSKIHNGRRGKRLFGVYLAIRKGKGRNDPKDGFYGRWLNSGFKGKAGLHFIDGAYRSQKGNAVRLIVASAKRGAEVIARRLRLR